MNQPEVLSERFGAVTVSVSTRDAIREIALRALTAEAPLAAPTPIIVVPKIGEYWAAQGGICGGRYIDEEDRTYALIVSRRAEGEIVKAGWDDALRRAAALRIENFDDWSLFNRPEGLGVFERLRPLLKGTDDAFAEEVYWTSAQYAYDAAYAWFQSFGYGGQFTYVQSSQLRARAVRRVKL